MRTCRRGQIFVDRDVQFALMLRVTGYWMFCLLSISLMLICWSAYTGPSRPFIDLATDLYHRYGPCLIASLLLLPVAMMDVLRLSNRFVGPVSRMRSTLKELAGGRDVERMHFRDDDYWRELAGDLNEVATRLKQNQA